MIEIFPARSMLIILRNRFYTGNTNKMYKNYQCLFHFHCIKLVMINKLRENFVKVARFLPVKNSCQSAVRTKLNYLERMASTDTGHSSQLLQTQVNMKSALNVLIITKDDDRFLFLKKQLEGAINPDKVLIFI